MAEGSRPDLSLCQVGRIHVLTLPLALLDTHLAIQPRLDQPRHATVVERPNGPGGESGVVPPVPLPNTVVKRSSADDTRVIKPWENRPVPGPFGRPTTWSLRAHRLYWCAPTRGGAVVARRAHNPKVSGSNPLPATSTKKGRFPQGTALV